MVASNWLLDRVSLMKPTFRSLRKRTRALTTKATRRKTSSQKIRFKKARAVFCIYPDFAGGFDETAIQLRGHDCHGHQRVWGEQAETLSDLRLDKSQVSLLSGSPFLIEFLDKSWQRIDLNDFFILDF